MVHERSRGYSTDEVRTQEVFTLQRILSQLTRAPLLAAVVGGLLFVAGGLSLAAALSAGPVIRACANKKSGALRVAARCRRNERRISWNQFGAQGARGPAGQKGTSGARGAAGPIGQSGATGPQGPAGPGAKSFALSMPAESGEATLATDGASGTSVKGLCTSKSANVVLSTASGAPSLQASGTVANAADLTVTRVDSNGSESQIQATSGVGDGDIDVIARASTSPAFSRFMLHVHLAAEKGPCLVWGVITPSG
jgi:hypothetical protein